MSGLKRIAAVGSGLSRPECVLTTNRGHIHVSDARGGVQTIFSDGKQRLLSCEHLLPNGIALLPDGSFLVANMGRCGGVWRLTEKSRAGAASPFLMECEGRGLGIVNFVLVDERLRVWISISDENAAAGNYSRMDASGRILLLEGSNCRVVAEGLCWANECRLDRDGHTLFVNETFARRTTAFTVSSTGGLSNRRIVAEFGAGTFPDGINIDADGGLWITSIISNRVIRVSASGHQDVLVETPSPDLALLETAYEEGALTRTLLHDSAVGPLGNVSSLAFGGLDLRTIYLGSLAGSQLPAFVSPWRGSRPVHWFW